MPDRTRGSSPSWFSSAPPGPSSDCRLCMWLKVPSWPLLLFLTVWLEFPPPPPHPLFILVSGTILQPVGSSQTPVSWSWSRLSVHSLPVSLVRLNWHLKSLFFSSLIPTAFMDQNQGTGCFPRHLPEVRDLFIQHKRTGCLGAREPQWGLDRKPGSLRGLSQEQSVHGQIIM